MVPKYVARNAAAKSAASDAPVHQPYSTSAGRGPTGCLIRLPMGPTVPQEWPSYLKSSPHAIPYPFRAVLDNSTRFFTVMTLARLKCCQKNTERRKKNQTIFHLLPNCSTRFYCSNNKNGRKRYGKAIHNFFFLPPFIIQTTSKQVVINYHLKCSVINKLQYPPHLNNLIFPFSSCSPVFSLLLIRSNPLQQRIINV